MTDSMVTQFKRAVQVALLNPRAMRMVARDDRLTGTAFTFMGLSFVIAALGSWLFPVQYGDVFYRPTLGEAIVTIIQSTFLVLSLLVLIHFLSERLFRGKGTFLSMMRVVGYGYVVGFLTLFPMAAFLALIWILVIVAHVLLRVKKLNVHETIITLLLALGVMFSLLILIEGLNAGNLYGGLYVAPY